MVCVSLVCVLLLAFGLNSVLWPRSRVPEGVAISGVLASSSFSGLMSGCEMAVYRLSEETALSIQKNGLRALRLAHPSGNEHSTNPYGSWEETPGRIDIEKNGTGATHTVYGLYALGGCKGEGETDTNYHSLEMHEALKERGSYYQVSRNEEGIFVIVPSRRLAAYYYWG